MVLNEMEKRQLFQVEGDSQTKQLFTTHSKKQDYMISKTLSCAFAMACMCLMRILRDILMDLAQKGGCTILISSHILGELEKVATHYGIIRGGKLIAQMTARELEADCPVYIALKTGNMEKTKNLLQQKYEKVEEDEKGYLRVYDDAESGNIAFWLHQQGITVSEISTDKISLEEYYMDLMDKKGAR